MVLLNIITYFVLSDINECSSNNGGCSDICTNMIGSFSCSCHEGFVLDNDGLTCQGKVILLKIFKCIIFTIYSQLKKKINVM